MPELGGRNQKNRRTGDAYSGNFYYSFINPYLIYCIEVRGIAFYKYLSLIVKIQKHAVIIELTRLLGFIVKVLLPRDQLYIFIFMFELRKYDLPAILICLY